MNRRDIQAFIERDWGRIAAAKDAHWLERKRRLGLAEGSPQLYPDPRGRHRVGARIWAFHEED